MAKQEEEEGDQRDLQKRAAMLALKNHTRLGVPIPKCAEVPCDGAKWMAPFGSIRGDCVDICSSEMCKNGEIVRRNLFGIGNSFLRVAQP